MKQCKEQGLDRDIRMQRQKTMGRLAAMSPKGEPQGWYAMRLRERVQAAVTRRFGGRTR